MEENKQRGIIIIGSGTDYCVSEIINSVMIKHEGKIILMDKENLPDYEKKINSELLLKSDVVKFEMNQRGVVPPNYYKKRR